MSFDLQQQHATVDRERKQAAVDALRNVHRTTTPVVTTVTGLQSGASNTTTRQERTLTLLSRLRDPW